jgi:predicted alpha/beta-fold hydrolase
VKTAIVAGHWATLSVALPAWPPATFTWERLTLPDGDFLDLAFPYLPATSPVPGTKPVATLWLLPGLSSRADDAHYLRRFLGQQHNRPWQVIIWHGRGQSGVLNRRPRFWSAVDFADFLYAVRIFQARFPECKHLAVGFSMGALVLLHALAADGALFARAAAVSAPLQPAAVAERLNRGFSRFYRDRLLRKLEAQVRAKFPHLPVGRCKSFREFDACWTAPLHGFASVDAYYEAADITKKWQDITTPTLLLQAANDPFFPAAGFPPPPARLFLQREAQGGHLGFKRQVWRQVWDFLDLFQSDRAKLE